jgi:Ca2+-binding EF-hand superfamily protein
MINQSSDHLKEMFDKFDTSGDGFIDAKELIVALRVTTGEDLTLDESQKLINAADVDGDGVINFEEFKAICEGEHR